MRPPPDWSRAGLKFVAVLRKKLVLIAACNVVIATALIAGVLLLCARQTAVDITRDANERTTSLAAAIDLEVSGALQLLRGLSLSQAVQTGDLKAIYNQMIATRTPEGTALIFADTQRQLIHTRQPFGADLGRITDTTLRQLKKAEWYVSHRTIGHHSGKFVVAVALRINGTDGMMKNAIAYVFNADRLSRILQNANLPAGWHAAIADEHFSVIAHTGHMANAAEWPAATDANAQSSISTANAGGEPQMVIYRKAPISSLVAMVSLPLATIEAPTKHAVRQAAIGGASIIILGSLGMWIVIRRWTAPIDTMRAVAGEIESQLQRTRAQLTSEQAAFREQLSHLREDERQQIAGALQDSTQQYLVAADLHLLQLRRQFGGVPSASRPLEQISELLERAQKELRVFTYLLYPPELAEEGFSSTLRRFVAGFSERTGLHGEVRLMDEDVDGYPEKVHRCLLRVTQEALSNVHRHAQATSFRVEFDRIELTLRLSIRDDGCGFAADAHGQDRIGVGLQSMRGRLREFSGSLTVSTGAEGTLLVAALKVWPSGRLDRRINETPDLEPKPAPHAQIDEISAA